MPAAPGLRRIEQVPMPSVGFAGSLSFTFYWAVRQTVSPGWRMEPGRRDHAVLCLITDGQLHLQMPSAEVDCKAGALIVFPPGSCPQAENRTVLPATRYVLSFDMRVWGEVDFFRLYSVPPIRQIAAPEELIQPWESLLAQLSAHQGAVTLGAEGWARVLVDRWLTDLEASGELQPATRADERLTAALAAIDADLCADWSLARLAEVMCLSPVRVRQIFASEVGVPPARYITLRRLAHARTLLAGTGLTSVEIAERCGFADPRHFSRVFCRLTGVRPTRYREQTRLQQD